MSAFELNDLMMSWYAMMGQDASMYLALVSGYLLDLDNRAHFREQGKDMEHGPYRKKDINHHALRTG